LSNKTPHKSNKLQADQQESKPPAVGFKF